MLTKKHCSGFIVSSGCITYDYEDIWEEEDWVDGWITNNTFTFKSLPISYQHWLVSFNHDRDHNLTESSYFNSNDNTSLKNPFDCIPGRCLFFSSDLFDRFWKQTHQSWMKNLISCHTWIVLKENFCTNCYSCFISGNLQLSRQDKCWQLTFLQPQIYHHVYYLTYRLCRLSYRWEGCQASDSNSTSGSETPLDIFDEALCKYEKHWILLRRPQHHLLSC